jgi:hypothetical protein
MLMVERTKDAEKKDRMGSITDQRKKKSSRHGQAPTKQQSFLVVVSIIPFVVDPEVVDSSLGSVEYLLMTYGR